MSNSSFLPELFDPSRCPVGFIRPASGEVRRWLNDAFISTLLLPILLFYLYRVPL